MTRLNVALQPPPPVSARLARLAGEVLPAGPAFRVGDGERSPHLTLYIAEFDAQSLDAVLARVVELAGAAATTVCSAQGLSRTAGGYVEVAYAKTTALTAMQRDVAERLRELALPVTMPSHVIPTDDQLRNLERYRYELMGDSFRPHVTLGRLAAGDRAVFSDADLPALSFGASDVMVAVADGHGAARHILLRAALGSGG